MVALVLWRAGAHEEARAMAAEVVAAAPEHGYASLIAEVEWADEPRVEALLARGIEAEASAISLGTTIAPVLRRLIAHPVYGTKVRRLSLFAHLGAAEAV